MILIWWYISDFFLFVYEIISSVISWFIEIFVLIGTCLAFVFEFIVELPVIITIPIIGVISVSIIYKIMGRGDQS